MNQSVTDNFLELSGLTPDFRRGFLLGRGVGLLNPHANEETAQGFELGRRYLNKPEGYILEELRRTFAIDPLNARAFALLTARNSRGLRTYATTLHDAKLDRVALLRHQIDELADALMYSLALLATYEEAE